MKTYSHIARRRVHAALRLERAKQKSGTARALPEVVMDPLVDFPAEVIDLATGPYLRRFPRLAARSRAKSRRGDS